MNTQTRNKTEPLKLIIIGGGYAGLSALITLRKQAPDAEITLIDPRPYHLIITRLHETVHHPLNTIQVPYSLLSKRFDFIHKQQAIHFDEQQLNPYLTHTINIHLKTTSCVIKNLRVALHFEK